MSLGPGEASSGGRSRRPCRRLALVLPCRPPPRTPSVPPRPADPTVLPDPLVGLPGTHDGRPPWSSGGRSVGERKLEGFPATRLAVVWRGVGWALASRGKGDGAPPIGSLGRALQPSSAGSFPSGVVWDRRSAEGAFGGGIPARLPDPGVCRSAVARGRTPSPSGLVVVRPSSSSRVPGAASRRLLRRAFEAPPLRLLAGSARVGLPPAGPAFWGGLAPCPPVPDPGGGVSVSASATLRLVRRGPAAAQSPRGPPANRRRTVFPRVRA